MASLPHLADIQCRKLVFEPGSRIIVRHYRPLDAHEKRKIRRAVEKWARVAVEVLFVDVTVYDISVEPPALVLP